MTLTVGIDLTEVEEIDEAIRRFGARYLRRVYTDAERAACGDNPRRLAACFAVKEAVAKALAAPDPWLTSIVLRSGLDNDSVTLTGPAAQRMQARGVDRLTVSVTRSPRQAMAIAVAEGAA
jgi:holo-[acyl-carrier protein] synthase